MDNSLVSSKPTSSTLNSVVLVHTHQLHGRLGWLVTFNPQLPLFPDNLYCSPSNLNMILSVEGPVVTLLQGSFIDLASVAEILHKLAIMKLRRSGEEIFELL